MAGRRPPRGAGEGLLRPTPRPKIVLAQDDMIAALVELNANGLCLQWRNHLGGTPPAHLPRWLLMRILAYRIQAAAHGGTRQRDAARPSPTEGSQIRIIGLASFRSADCDNAGRDQARGRGSARPRMEWPARACDDPRPGLRLEWRDLRQPVASRQGDDWHELERSSLLRLANGRVRAIRDGPSQVRGLRRRCVRRRLNADQRRRTRFRSKT